MIVVNLARSYQQLVELETVGVEQDLLSITQGEWPPLSESSLEGYADLLVGVFQDVIVTAYRIARVQVLLVDGVKKMVFQVEPPVDRDLNPVSLDSDAAREPAAWLIGCPIPGGPWKRGEARGTRRWLLEDYLDDHPDLAARQSRRHSPQRAVQLLRYFQGKDVPDAQELFPALRPGTMAAPEPGVTVVREPGGTVVITIPTGTRAQVNIEPN